MKGKHVALIVFSVLLLGWSTMWSAVKVSFTPDDTDEWGATPTTVDEALEDIVARRPYLDAVANGLVADGVDASNCVGTNPPVCSSAGSGTDNSTSFAAMVDKAVSSGIRHIHFPYSGTGKYRLNMVVDEDDITISCAPGVLLMPPYDDPNGGWVLQVASSGEYVYDPRIYRCHFYDDYPTRNNHEFTILNVSAPTGVVAVDAITAAADYNAVACTGTCGAGDDIHWVGPYTGGGVDQDNCGSRPNANCAVGIEFEVEIVAEGSPDTFRWRRNSGHWRNTQEVTTDSNAPIFLEDGISIYWDDDDNHTAGDLWTVLETPTPQVVLTDTAHGLGGQETIEIYDADQTTYHDTYIVGYVDADHFTIRSDYADHAAWTGQASWRQVPGIGEDVDFTGGGEGVVARYDEVNDWLMIHETTGTIAAGNTVEYDGGGEWSVTVSSVEKAATPGVAMGGILFSRAYRPKCIDCIFENFAGPSVEIGSNETGYRSYFAEIKSDFLDCPSIPSKDACMDIRQSYGANVHDTTMKCGVSAGYAFQYCLTLATAQSATVAPANTVFDNLIIEDNDTLDPAGPIGMVDGGIIFQPNAENVDFDTAVFNGGMINVRHVYDDPSRGDYPTEHAAISIGANDARILNLNINGTNIRGAVDINAHNENTISFGGNFMIDAALGNGLTARVRNGKIGPGTVKNAPSRGVMIEVPAEDGSLEVTNVNVLNTGVGARSGSGLGHVYIGSITTGTVYWRGGKIIGAPSSVQDFAGFRCLDYKNLHVSGVTIRRTLGRGILDCSGIISGNEMYKTSWGIQLTSGSDDGNLIGNRVYSPQTASGTANGCFHLRGDNTILSFNQCFSDATTAIDEDGNYNVVIGNFSADSDGSSGGGAITVAGTGSVDDNNTVK